MGKRLIEQAEWLGGRDRLKLAATTRLVLQHMALRAWDNGGMGVGDERRYGQTKKGDPAQLFTESREKSCDTLGISPRKFAEHVRKLAGIGIIERVSPGHKGSTAAYRLHVAEMYDQWQGPEKT
ncbi:hypothetical protein [Bifidobacterium saguinibicoloris]|uniref:hypothetical protein n=1 Tax=Bifidobacterium saguinibicoloris TaxID=2834433 RepID=UPI001C58C352|nr:hypothetical protein [Bifidobacterium saguinibicoloris]MBW3080519.1 hypothetical protein [Bifidobacterium saguinibicoloris]